MRRRIKNNGDTHVSNRKDRNRHGLSTTTKSLPNKGIRKRSSFLNQYSWYTSFSMTNVHVHNSMRSQINVFHQFMYRYSLHIHVAVNDTFSPAIVTFLPKSKWRYGYFVRSLSTAKHIRYNNNREWWKWTIVPLTTSYLAI